MTFRFALRSAAIAILLCAWALPAYALDLVQTRDGKTLTGKVRLTDTGITLADEKQIETPLPWSAIRDIQRDALAAPDAAQKGSGTGLKAEFFSTPDHKELKTVRIDPNIDFDWTTVSPAARVPRDNFSVRWTGQLEPRYSENYTFSAVTDAHIRVWVNGVSVNALHIGTPEHEQLAIPLKAGQRVDLRVEANHWWGNAVDRLYWESPSQPRQVIPADRLYLPPGFQPEDAEKLLFAQALSGGLKAEHFADPDFKKLIRTQLDHVIDSHGIDRPDPDLKTPGAARWTGQLLADSTDRYTLDVLTDWGRGIRLWVDGKLLIDNWHTGGDAMGPARKGSPINLQAGKRYDFKMEMTAHQGAHQGELIWKTPSSNGTSIPSDHFFPPPEMPRVAIVSPFDAAHFDQRDALTVKAFAEVAPGRITRVDLLDNGKLRGSLTTAPYTFKLDHLDPDANVLVARAYADSDLQSSSVPVTIWTEPHADLLGAPWCDHLVGIAGPPLPIEKNGSQLTLTAAKGDALGENDAFRFLYRPLDAEGQITVKILSLQSPPKGDLPNPPQVFSGISIRDALSPTARSLSLLVTPKNAWLIRRTPDSQTPESQEVPAKLPCTLRLVRDRQQIRVYLSKDGITWERLAAPPIVWEGRCYVGVTAFTDADSPGKATLENLEVTAGVPMLATTAGVQTRDGSFIAGQILSIEPQAVTLARRGEPDRKFVARDVAKVLFHALSTDTANAAIPGKTGAILATGDFMESSFQRFKDQHASFVSLEFGAASVEVNDLTAIVFQDLDPNRAQPNWRIETRDGSSLLVKDLHIVTDKLATTTLGGEEFSLPGESVRQLTALEK